MRRLQGSEEPIVFGSILLGMLALLPGLLLVLPTCYPDAIGGCPIYDVVEVTVAYSRIVMDWDKGCTTRYRGLLPCYDVHVYLSDIRKGKDCTIHWKYDNEDLAFVNATLQTYEVGSKKLMKRTREGICEIIKSSEKGDWIAGTVFIVLSIPLFLLSFICGMNAICSPGQPSQPIRGSTEENW